MFNMRKYSEIGKDPNLIQGREFLNLKRHNEKNLAQSLLIKRSSSPEIGSIIEALQNDDSTQANDSVEIHNVSNLENEFNKTLMEYTQTHQLIVEELTKNKKNNYLSQYFGRNIKNDGNYYYVNDYGFTHKYSNASWSNRSESCSNKLISVGDDVFNKLTQANAVGVGQACKIAGKNIENRQTQEKAWVDIKGSKHVYSKELWNKKNLSCNSKTLILDNSEYINIPLGTPMMDTTNCNTIDIDPKLLKKLENLNNKLIILAKQLLTETQSLTVTDKQLSQELDTMKKQVSDRINKLEMDKKKLKNGNLVYTNDSVSLKNIKTDTYQHLQSSYNKYYYMLFLTFIILLFVIHNLSNSNESKLLQATLLIGSIYILYKILNYFIKNIL